MGEVIDFLVQNEEAFRKPRLPALYSDFQSLRTTNPDGYQANILSWRRALANAAWAGVTPSPTPTHDRLVLHVDDRLVRALDSRQFGRPISLGAVIQESIQNRDLWPAAEFLQAKQSIHHKPWSSLPWSLVAWSLRQVGLSGSTTDDKLPKGEFVILPNLELAAKSLGEELPYSGSRLERTYSKNQFQQQFANAVFAGSRALSERDLNVLLKYMSRDKGLMLYDGHTIKVKAPEETDVTITPDDTSIAQLKELIQYLGRQTSILETRIERLGTTAKDAVSRKNRVAALAALKSKKLAETSLQQRFGTLSQLEEVAAKIEQAADHVQLVSVMESSAEVLKSLNTQIGGVERVDGAVDRIREQMAEVDEVGSILNEATSAGVTVDEGEIDDELEAMMEQEREKEAEAERVRKEAEQRREAEATRMRLEKIEPVQEAVGMASARKGDETQTNEAAEGIRRISLEEQPQPQLTS